MNRNISFVLLILFCNITPNCKRVCSNGLKKVQNNNTGAFQDYQRETRIRDQEEIRRQRHESQKNMSNYTQLLEDELNITRRTDISPSTKWLLKSMLYKQYWG